MSLSEEEMKEGGEGEREQGRECGQARARTWHHLYVSKGGGSESDGFIQLGKRPRLSASNLREEGREGGREGG